MGLRYLDGNGVVQSDALAREWLTKASANGNLKARARLRALNSPKYAGEITLDESTH
jgi:TPR repeat protein